MTPAPWRIGRKLGRTLYVRKYTDRASDEDRFVGIMDTPEDAKRVVDAVNAVARLRGATMPDTTTLHDRLAHAFTAKLVDMWQPTVGHSCTGDLPALQDDARVLANLAETILRQRVQTLEAEIDRLRAYLAYATRFDVCGVEVYPQGDAWMCRGSDGLDEHDGPYEALNHARQRAGVEQ